MLDEKEELVTQRDAYKGKTHRLNHQLRVALRAPADSTLDVDSLVTENRSVARGTGDRFTHGAARRSGCVVIRVDGAVIVTEVGVMCHFLFKLKYNGSCAIFITRCLIHKLRIWCAASLTLHASFV